MIELVNVSKSFDKNKVLDDFSYVFFSNSNYCIMGASGSGKTTLINILLGLLKQDSGIVNGVPRDISAVFQEDRLCESYSAVENVLAITGESVPKSDIIALLGDLGLSGSEYAPVSTLSGGMKRRVAIARALLAKSDLIVFDEPFKGLDIDTRDRVIEVVKEYTRNKTLIFASHDENDAFDLDAEIIEI